MEKKLALLMMILLLAACSTQAPPVETPNIQATIDAGILLTQNAISALEPTLTPTKEYCPETETKKAMEEIGTYISKMVAIAKEGLTDYEIRRENIVELTLLSNDLSNYEVPECLEKQKELLGKAIQNLIDAYTKEAGGNQAEYMENMANFSINLDLFTAESNRIFECFPDCKP